MATFLKKSKITLHFPLMCVCVRAHVICVHVLSLQEVRALLVLTDCEGLLWD